MGNNTSSQKQSLHKTVSSVSASQSINVEPATPSTASVAEDDSSWILECMVEFVKSPECSIFVDGFIDENCLVFDTNQPDPDVLVQYQQIHSRYKEVVESLIVARMHKLGLTVHQFHDAMQKANQGTAQLMNVHILQYIIGIEDFTVFQNLMIHRNIQLEKEAIRYLEEQQTTQKPMDLKKMTEEEQLMWAMQQSLEMEQSKSEQQSMRSDENGDDKIEDIIPPTTPLLDQETASNDGVNGNKDKDENGNQNGDGNGDQNQDPFEMLSNISLSKPRRVSLKPLNLSKKSGGKNINVGMTQNQNEEHLPMLTAESIQNIKNKQSSKQNAILERKRMILKMRKKQRSKEIEKMSDVEEWTAQLERLHTVDSTSTSNPPSLPPLHKSLFANLQRRETIEEENIDPQSPL